MDNIVFLSRGEWCAAYLRQTIHLVACNISWQRVTHNSRALSTTGTLIGRMDANINSRVFALFVKSLERDVLGQIWLCAQSLKGIFIQVSGMLDCRNWHS